MLTQPKHAGKTPIAAQETSKSQEEEILEKIRPHYGSGGYILLVVLIITSLLVKQGGTLQLWICIAMIPIAIMHTIYWILTQNAKTAAKILTHPDGFCVVSPKLDESTRTVTEITIYQNPPKGIPDFGGKPIKICLSEMPKATLGQNSIEAVKSLL